MEPEGSLPHSQEPFPLVPTWSRSIQSITPILTAYKISLEINHSTYVLVFLVVPFRLPFPQ
jgi:hypothetical protein